MDQFQLPAAAIVPEPSQHACAGSSSKCKKKESLISRTVSPTAIDDGYGMISTAIEAAQQGNTEKIKEWVDLGQISVDWVDESGCTLLHWASANGRVDVVEYLICQKGATIISGGSQVETSLQWAARNGHLDVMSLLVRHGAGVDIHHKNVNGEDTFFICAMCEFRPGLMFLAAQGAKVNTINHEGLTPLLAVCKYRGGNLPLIRTLLALGCDFNRRDPEGNSAIHLCIKSGFDPIAITRVLLRYGTDTKISASSLSKLRGYHRKHSLGNALRKNSDGKDPIVLCRSGSSLGGAGGSQRNEMTAKYLSRIKFIHKFPAPLFYLVSPIILSISLLAALSFGLIPFGIVVIVGACMMHQYKWTLTPRQEDCLGVGVTLSIIILLVGEYLYRLRGHGLNDVVDMVLMFCLFMVSIMLTRAMVSDPGKVNGPTQSPYDVLDGIFDEKNFGPRAPAATAVNPSWESRRRCESCFAKRFPRARHCNHCESCIHRFDHHCPYIANCVGGGNHRLFMGLVITCVITVSLWIYVAVQFIQHATPERLDAIFHGDMRDVVTSLVVAILCLAWLLVLLGLQITLIGWDTTSREMYLLRQSNQQHGGNHNNSNSSDTLPLRPVVTIKQFLSNLFKFFIHTSPSMDHHHDHRHHHDQPLAPNDRRGVLSIDDPKWCSGV